MAGSQGQAVIAAALELWESALESVLLGTTDPATMVRMVDGFCLTHLGSRLDEVLFYRRGVGAVFGVALVDGRRVVIKVHRPELIPQGLGGTRIVQQRLAEVGLPAPMPLGEPSSLGHGIAAAEEMLDGGTVSDAHEPSVRQALAAGLHRFVDAATPLVGRVELPTAHPFGLPSGQLWPTPHDLRFDFSIPGGEWIDDLARDALEALEPIAGSR